MHIAIDIPDTISGVIAPEQDPARYALEALALEGYRSQRLGESAVRRLLGFQTRMEVHGFLKEQSLNMSLRKIIKTRGSFPNEESAVRPMWMALSNHVKKWSFVQGWREALNRFQIPWPERMPKLERS